MPTTRRLIRRPRSDESAAEPRRLTKRYDEDDDDEEENDDDQTLTVVKGWGGHRHIKAAAPSKWTKLYKVPDNGEGLILFLEDEPYASFMLHWCDWLRGGKQSFVCLQQDCPLCEIEAAQPRTRFNILDCDPSAPTPKLYTFECGITVADTLDKYHQDPKIGPLGGSYFAISMTGTKKNRRTNIRPIKKRDLVDDWKFDPLTEEQLDKFRQKLWTDADIERSSRDELREIADNAVR